MRKPIIAVSLSLLLTANLGAVEFRVSPDPATFSDEIAIELLDCTRGGVLHWGVNARGNQWKQALEAYRPAGSEEDGVATRTPLDGPDADGTCSVKLGPFDSTNQLVGTVDFAIQWDDDTWDTADSRDYHIPIHRGRISIEPAAPTLNDKVVVSVHRGKDAGQLRWGVNASHGMWNQPHTNYWPSGSVPSDDGLAVDTPLSSPDAEGLSIIELGPFSDPAQVVSNLHMAVHWGDDWDTDFGRNYNSGIAFRPADEESLRIVAPVVGAAIDGDVRVELDVADTEHVTLWLDGDPEMSFIGAPYVHEIPAERLALGLHVLTACSDVEGGVALDQVELWRIPEYDVEPLPAGIGYGATVSPDGEVTFAIYAPGKHFVSVVGDFNEWDSLANIMKRAPDGSWWIQLPLPEGEHLFQYCIDGALYLADPYSTDVEWKDEKGKETHLPEMAKSVVRVGGPEFEWTDAEFVRPGMTNLLIYEFFIEDLCPGQGFTGVIAKLDYIQDLGVNAIEPLPFHEFAGAESWGYNPAYHFAPETVYGTPDELKQLVDESHRRGMAVIMDTVLNHMDAQSPVFQLYGLNYEASPYFHLFLGENWGFPDLDQESEAFKRYVADMLRFWIEEYHIDGFRYDATRWTGWKGYNDWGASWFAFAGKQADPGTYHIAEHLPTDPDLMNQTEMDTGWHAHFRWRLREMLRDGELNTNEFPRIMQPLEIGFTDVVQRITYVESHDEERIMGELLEAGYSEDEAVRRAIAGLAITMTAPGIVMTYGGQEFGEDTKKVVGANPLNWSYLNDPERRRIYDAFRVLSRLRVTHPALTQGTIQFLSQNSPEDTVVYMRGDDSNPVIVAVNFGKEPQAVPLTLSEATWANALDPNETAVSGGQHSVVLEGGEAFVFVRAED